MSNVTELGYVVFGVSDLGEWREFATQLLGLEAATEPAEPNRLYLRTDYWHHRIVLEQDARDDLIAAGMRVAGAEEFQSVADQLKRAGVAVEACTKAQAEERKVLELMRLQDPAGNPIEIFHGPLIEPQKPFHPGRRMHSEFLTGTGGVGHMILRHNGLEAMHKFYSLLGLRGGIEYKVPTPNGAAEILFMHCNDRDHTVAFGPPSKKHVNHLMLEVGNLDDVFMTHDLIQKSKYPVMISLGKHANDHMFSFYCGTPSGWMIEIGYGGRPSTHQSEYYRGDTYGHEFMRGVGPGMSVDRARS